MTAPTVELLICILATTEIIEVFHHGSIFAGLRARLQETSWWWLYSLSNCMFCLSVWAGTAVAALYFLAAVYSGWLMLPLYGLALARGSNLLNDLTHRWCRTPRYSPGTDDHSEDSVGMEPD